MDKLESSYSQYAKPYELYKVACSKCLTIFYKANGDPFVCLECNTK